VKRGWKKAPQRGDELDSSSGGGWSHSRRSGKEKEKQLGTGCRLGSVAVGYTHVLDNSEKLGKGRNTFRRNMKMIILV